eukprot:TRINITY_DN22401_c0_g1_i1.p1 TRINITY_DN22401_c0_g1~~TRINITY_DN22401_c0_g1_i1.p1  ORF type:complete len:726 (-),score=122.81 TRINITY_DN22401_c0_g1_i1:108-2285(-)
MQPFVYLTLRGLITLFQFQELSQRAFLSSPTLALAGGVAHCWAVSYALILSLVLHSARISGHAWLDTLPWFAIRAEQLAFASGTVWWIAGLGTTCVRALRVDEETMGLPTDMRDATIPKILIYVQSPKCRKALAFAQTLSCVGVFLSIILLCIAIFSMGRDITIAEFSLAAVSLSFGIPHVMLAWDGMQGMMRTKTVPDCRSLLAAAAEASALGPQFAVILACADVAGLHSFWQQLLCVLAVLAFVASLGTCSYWPHARAGAVEAPALSVLCGSLALDVIAGWLVLRAIPALSGGLFFWLFGLITAAIGIGILFKECRLLILEFLEPIMPLLSPASGMAPVLQHEAARLAARGLLLLCSGMILVANLQHNTGSSNSQMQYRDTASDYSQERYADYDPSLGNEMEDHHYSDYHDDYHDHYHSWDGMDYYAGPPWSEDWTPMLALRYAPPTTTTIVMPPDKEPCLKEHTYHKGNMVNDHTGASSAFQCLQHCDEEPSCHYWDYGEGICRLRAGAGEDGGIHDAAFVGGPRGCHLVEEHYVETPDYDMLLNTAGEAMGLEPHRLIFRDIFTESRILLFSGNDYYHAADIHYDDPDGADSEGLPNQPDRDMHLKWQRAVAEAEPGSNLSLAVEVGAHAFPAYLNATLCRLTSEHRERGGAPEAEAVKASDVEVAQDGNEAADSADMANGVAEPDPLEREPGLATVEARDAYFTACQAWRRQQGHYDSFD